MNELLAIRYSPWSEKARWALDHHGIPYTECEYTPMLSEPGLRARLKKWRGKITIPILFTATRTISDSFAIAHFAEESSRGTPPLFPEELESEVVRWNERSEAALRAGRALVAQRVLEDPAAKREALPRSIPPAARSLMSPIASLGVSYLRRKYEFDDTREVQHRNCEQVFEELQAALEGSDYLVGGTFSYADVCMATSLQFVRPVTDEYIRLGPATRLAWTDDLLAGKYPTLLDWRDRIYQEHRTR